MRFDFRGSQVLLAAIVHSSVAQAFDGDIIAAITACLDGFKPEERRELRPLLYSAQQAHQAHTSDALKNAA